MQDLKTALQKSGSRGQLLKPNRELGITKPRFLSYLRNGRTDTGN